LHSIIARKKHASAVRSSEDIRAERLASARMSPFVRPELAAAQLAPLFVETKTPLGICTGIEVFARNSEGSNVAVEQADAEALSIEDRCLWKEKTPSPQLPANKSVTGNCKGHDVSNLSNRN